MQKQKGRRGQRRQRDEKVREGRGGKKRMEVSPAVIPFLTQPSTLGVGCELRENPIRKQCGDYIRSDIETTTRAKTFSLVLMRWDFWVVSGEQE